MPVAFAAFTRSHRCMGGFALQLVKAGEAARVELSLGNGGEHGAADFGFMATVAEVTLSCEQFDVVEDGSQATLDGAYSEFPHARRIDDPRAALQSKHFACRCRVTTLAVVLANASGLL